MRGGILLATMAAFWAGSAAAQSYSSCVAGLQAAAVKAGVSRNLAAQALDGARPDEKVLRLSKSQPEFKTPIWDYLGFLVDDERVQDGRGAMRQWGQALATAEARYGVDRHVIAGVWGVESNFGKDIGGRPLVQSLATLSCYGSRRRDYFTGELFATLKIIENGDIPNARLTGSWAGAFGHTQFMPSTYQRLAVDLDGDGRPELVIPTFDRNALAVLTLKGGIKELRRIALPSPAGRGLAALGAGKDAHILAALEDGRLVVMRP